MWLICLESQKLCCMYLFQKGLFSLTISFSSILDYFFSSRIAHLWFLCWISFPFDFKLLSLKIDDLWRKLFLVMNHLMPFNNNRKKIESNSCLPFCRLQFHLDFPKALLIGKSTSRQCSRCRLKSSRVNAALQSNIYTRSMPPTAYSLCITACTSVLTGLVIFHLPRPNWGPAYCPFSFLHAFPPQQCLLLHRAAA